MDEPLINKRKSKKSQKGLVKSPRGFKPKRLICMPNTLQKKLKRQKILRLCFGDSPEERVNDAYDILKNCHRLSEKFATLRINNESRTKKFHDLADKLYSDGEDLLKNFQSFSELFTTPKESKEDNISKDISSISINVDVDVDVSKIFKDALKDLLAKSNPSEKIINIDLTIPNPLGESQANPVEIKLDKLEIVQAAKLLKVHKPVEDYPEKINTVAKQPEKDKVSFLPEKNVPEKLQIVPKSTQERKDMPDEVSNPTDKLIGPLEKNSTLIYPKKFEKGMSLLEAQGFKDFRFSSAEKKKVGNYNTNLFNPARNQPKLIKRNIVLDGNNVGFAHGKSWFSSKGLQYCLQYFEKRGHVVKAVVPIFRRNAFQSSDPKILDELNKRGNIVFTPCKNFNGQKIISNDDRFVLQLACEWNAAVVSNDNYRDMIYESPSFRRIVETRVLGYTWRQDIFILVKEPYGRFGPSLEEILHI